MTDRSKIAFADRLIAFCEQGHIPSGVSPYDHIISVLAFHAVIEAQPVTAIRTIMDIKGVSVSDLSQEARSE